MKSFLLAVAVFATAALTQGVPPEGDEKPCCRCEPSDPAVVCTALDSEDDACIINPVKCPFEEDEQEYCCCCNPNYGEGDDTTEAIVCQAKEKGQGCLCPAVECNIPWEEEWAETYIPQF